MATGLGQAGIITAAASILSAVTTGVSVGLQHHMARTQFQHRKKIDNIQLAMDLQAHQLAMAAQEATLIATRQNLQRAERISAAQEEVTMATIDAQEKAVKTGDWSEAERAVHLQKSAIESGSFDVMGRERAHQAAVVTAAAQKREAPWLVWVALGVGAIALLR